MTLRLAIVGAAGRMGQRLVALAVEDPALHVVAQIDAAGPPLSETPVDAVDAVIDFSVQSSLQPNADVCAARGWALVVGTTGLTADDHIALDRAATKTAVLWAPNFSVGINTLLGLIGKAAQMLGDDFDLEIVESHHRNKIDAPSGTARALGEALAGAKGWSYGDVIKHGREGLVGKRPAREIGMAAVRGGSVVGEHTVFYLGPDEQVSISHRATDRDIFVRGALRASKWLGGRAPGRYSMADVLG